MAALLFLMVRRPLPPVKRSYLGQRAKRTGEIVNLSERHPDTKHEYFARKIIHAASREHLGRRHHLLHLR